MMISQRSQTRSPTKRRCDVPEIGSDFELVKNKYLIPINSRRFPWEGAADITYVESGRQALALVEVELRRQGHTHLHVPSYLCDSMIYPFQSSDWTLTELPVDNDLAVHPNDLLSRVTTGVLLHTPYFGRQDSPTMLAALDTLQRRGIVVIVDETHRVFSRPSPVADIRVASLRKLLPLYDGGYVTGLSGRFHQSLQTSAPESTVLRKRAMRAKSAALALGDGDETHLTLFARAEQATQIRTEPTPMSRESLSLLHQLNIELIRSTREANAITLTNTLGQSDRFRIINLPTKDVLPSHLILETDDVTELRRYLIRRRIYCPIHWPPSEFLSRIRTWPNRYISLPIDHRYGEPDMLRVAACVKTFFEKNQKESNT
jgi:hypothetical protein